MSDQRYAELLLKRFQAIGKQVWRGMIFVNAGMSISPVIRGALGVEPAIELKVSKRHALLPKLVANRQQRIFITEFRLKMVIVSCSVVGPITKMGQSYIGVVGRPNLAS